MPQNVKISLKGLWPRPPMLSLLAFGLLILAAVAVGWWRPQIFGGDPDRSTLDSERRRRLAFASHNQTLPDTPDVTNLPARLDAAGLTLGAPLFIRIFKREFELEVWIRRADRYHRLAVYPICRFSGSLGPKLVEGDRQSPEGFYTVDRRAMNPQSRWHRSFNLGFPNALDRSHGRTGSFLMVHGGCSSVGCYAMTNAVVDELWRLVDTSLKNGQKQIHVHVFPFRMTQDNLDARKTHAWSRFWTDLKAGYDAFETTHVPPRIAVCDGRYRVQSRSDDASDTSTCTDTSGNPLSAQQDAASAPGDIEPTAGKPSLKKAAKDASRKLSGGR